MIYVDCYRAPLLLAEPEHAQHAASRVAGEDREPDVDWVEGAGLLNDETDAQWNNDLGNDGDEERALSIAGSLQSSGIGECDCNQETGDTENPKQPNSDIDHSGLSHPEDPQEDPRKKEKAEANQRGSGKTEPGRDMHCLLGPIGTASTEVLASYSSGGTHQSHRGPGDQREQLGIGDGKRRLRFGALGQRSNESQEDHTPDIHRDALNPRWQTKSEEFPDDLPIRTESPATGKGNDPAPTPELGQGVDGQQPRGDRGAHGGSYGPEGGYRAPPADENDIEDKVQNREHDAQNHRGPGVAR